MKDQFVIDWMDLGREPKCAPDPKYPEGIDVDCSRGKIACTALLPYPAKRCGQYYVECKLCRTNAIITTAGRPDDPRSLKLPCRFLS